MLSYIKRLRHICCSIADTYILYTLTYQNSLTLESFLRFAFMPNGNLSVLIMHCVCMCVFVIAVGVHLPCFHLLLLHAGGGGPAPVCHSQSQGAALCLQSAGQPPGEHALACGVDQG